jgi:uncharacterized protein
LELADLHESVLALPDDGSVVSAGSKGDTPLLADRDQLEGKPTVYVCRQFSCLLPVNSLEDLSAQLESDL